MRRKASVFSTRGSMIEEKKNRKSLDSGASLFNVFRFSRKKKTRQRTKSRREMRELEIDAESLGTMDFPGDSAEPPVFGLGTEMEYSQFFSQFLLRNRMCTFRAEVTQQWPCRSHWVDSKNAPNFEFLRKEYGSSKVPVANCGQRYYNSQTKETMTMSEFLTYWEAVRREEAPESLLYLKDWHCFKEYPASSIYRVPGVFASDWLNEYYLAHEHLADDYMFVYMGPKGSWTPLHADVFGSYSWSANIVGRKRWLFFPPGEEAKLRDLSGQLVFDVDSEELRDSSRYRDYDQGSVRSFEVFQNPGEVVFVPSGWYHQVWNLEDTISINHNWINACNIRRIWSLLQVEFRRVRQELRDCRDMEDWDDHCQLVLKLCHGINYPEFFGFLSFVAERRLLAVARKREQEQNPGKQDQELELELDPNLESSDRLLQEFGQRHLTFDLRQIARVLEGFLREVTEERVCESLGEEARLLATRVKSACGFEEIQTSTS